MVICMLFRDSGSLISLIGITNTSPPCGERIGSLAVFDS